MINRRVMDLVKISQYMKRIRKYISGTIARMYAFRIQKKTSLDRKQSVELARCLVPMLFVRKSLYFKQRKLFLKLLLQDFDWKNFCMTQEQFDKNWAFPTGRRGVGKSIGMWFTIDSEETCTDAPKVQNTERITYYASGREPFLAVAKYIAPKRKVVMMPHFICATVSQPFRENGWTIVYYKVKKDLKIDTAHMKAVFEKHKPSILIAMEYSGLDLTRDELETIGRIKDAGCVIIVDRTQNIYNEKQNREVDFYCGSLRKWFCCPDGAYLEKNGDIPLPPPPKADAYNDVYATACAAMMFANGLALKTQNSQYLKLGWFFRKLSASYVCGNPVRERNMSEYSKAVYLQACGRKEQYIQIRKSNFQYIWDRISQFAAVRPACEQYDRYSSAPMCCLIYVDDRTKFSQYLDSKGITLWNYIPRASRLKKMDEETEWMFRHILSLPCDQRYTRDDMKELCDAIEEYERQNGNRMPDWMLCRTHE